MSAITSIYIPRIDIKFNAEFIADVFDRNDIAQVSRVFIEPYKSIITDNSKYNKAYIGIKSWHPTEAAYNFIERLRNPSREARLVYNDDNWWPVFINTKPNKLASNKRVLTIFEEKYIDYNDDLISTTPIRDELDEFVHIDAEKTALLRSIVASFKKQSHDDEAAFDQYMREIDNDREKWFSEQYIYDSLNM